MSWQDLAWPISDLYYLLKSKEFIYYAANAAYGSANQARLSVTNLEKFTFYLPPLPEQHAIAHTLGSLDDKIELNNQMNKALESIAREFFKSWFVDFDPVRTKTKGRDPYGLDAEMAALFPDSFEDSTYSKIPRGWKVSKIGAIIEFAYGKALKEEVRHSGPISVYGSNGQVGWHNEALVTGPGIVVGRKGNPGTVTWVAKDFFPIDTTFYVIPKGPIVSMHYLYHALSWLDLASLSADSAVPGLNRNIAYMTDILVPTVEVTNLFERTVEPFFDKIRMNGEESRTLASIRDTLLPKLLSGEIRVKDAEKLVEAYV